MSAQTKQLPPITRIFMPREFFDSKEKYDRIQALIDFVNFYRGIGYKFEELPANAVQSYWVDYYLSQTHNGGLPQFVYNSKWNPLIVNNVREGLKNMNALQNLELLDELSRIVAERKTNVIGQKVSDADYAEWVESLGDKMGVLREKFYEVEQSESILEYNRQFIAKFDNLDLVSLAEYKARKKKIKE